MKLVYDILIPFVISCNSEPSNKLTKKLIKIDNLRNDLIGDWGGLGENIPVWKFSVDSVYYYEENKSYPYKFIDTDIVIERLQSKGVLRNIAIERDTLIFYDEHGLKMTGYRFKSKK